jgi:hypothetical protein
MIRLRCAAALAAADKVGADRPIYEARGVALASEHKSGLTEKKKLARA